MDAFYIYVYSNRCNKMDQIYPVENLITQNTCLGVMIKLIDWLNEWVRWIIVRGFHPLNLQSTCCMQVQPYRGRRWKHWIETPISIHLVLSQFISMSICILIKIVYLKIYSVYWGKKQVDWKSIWNMNFNPMF